MNPVKEPIDCPRVVESDRAHLAQLVGQLSRDLTESRKATESAQAAAEVERSNLKAALDRSCATVLQLTMKNAEERSATRRLCGQQVQLVGALRALFDLLTAEPRMCLSDEWQEARAKRVKEAEELLALVEVPFG